MKKIIALAAFAVLSAGASASTNLFVNGSFEDASTKQAAGTWNIVSSPLGWTVTSVDPTSKAAVGLEVRNGVAGTAKVGFNFIELDGNQNDKISQSFATVIGQKYTVSFYAEDRAGVAEDSMGFDASINSGTTTTSTDLDAFGDNGSKWHLVKMSFIANSTTSTFSLEATGTSDSLGTSFDGFSAVAVPEPGTLGLFAAGLAVLGLSARRRKQQ